MTIAWAWIILWGVGLFIGGRGVLRAKKAERAAHYYLEPEDIIYAARAYVYREYIRLAFHLCFLLAGVFSIIVDEPRVWIIACLFIAQGFILGMSFFESYTTEHVRKMHRNQRKGGKHE